MIFLEILVDFISHNVVYKVVTCSCLILLAKLQLDQDGIKTGIVLQPYSQCLVMNSHPGNLQFYDIEQNKLWLEV